MAIELKDVLDLVGKLDDSAGDETPRERFRHYLREQVKDVGTLRDYVQECLSNTGEQYNKALQDLVNRIGELLGFKVTYGRYRGVTGESGYDGLWKSQEDFYIVVEVKTTETYALSTKTLVGYVDDLITTRQIPNWQKALGLYLVGRPDPNLRQIENAIHAEGRGQQLRVGNLDAILTLAELRSEFGVEHGDLLRFILPPEPNITALIELVNSVAAQAMEGKTAEKFEEAEGTGAGGHVSDNAEIQYWMTPVQGEGDDTAEDVINSLLSAKIYAFGERTPGRTHLKPGDWICFYASGSGTVAKAQVKTTPARKPHKLVRNPERYPWTFTLEDVEMWLTEPLPIDETMRSQLDAFRNLKPSGAWGWFVATTRHITYHDFRMLTGGK